MQGIEKRQETYQVEEAEAAVGGTTGMYPISHVINWDLIPHLSIQQTFIQA